MTITPRERMTGVLAVVFASVLWGSTGTAATFAPDVSPLAIGAVYMGLGGLLQALISARRIVTSRVTLNNARMLFTGALAVWLSAGVLRLDAPGGRHGRYRDFPRFCAAVIRTD